MGAEGLAPEGAEDGAAQRIRAAADADDQIAGAIARGDHGAALALCAKHHAAALGRLCMAIAGSQAEAEDLVQDTLISAHAALGDWRQEASIRGWLFGIARKKCARHVERRARRESKLRLVRDSERSPGADERLALRQRAELAREALVDIRPSEREALLLRFASELSFREVGEACGIDEAAARKRVSRALARLRGRLSAQE